MLRVKLFPIHRLSRGTLCSVCWDDSPLTHEAELGSFTIHHRGEECNATHIHISITSDNTRLSRSLVSVIGIATRDPRDAGVEDEKR